MKPAPSERYRRNLQLLYYWDVEILGQLLPDLEKRLLHESSDWETTSITHGLIQNPVRGCTNQLWVTWMNSKDQGVVRNLGRAWSSPLPASRTSPWLPNFPVLTPDGWSGSKCRPREGQPLARREPREAALGGDGKMEEPWNGRRNRRGGAGIVVGRKRKRPSLTGEKKKP